MNKKETTPIAPETEAAVSEENKNKPRRIISTIINVILVIAIIIAALCTYVSFVSSSGNGVPNILGISVFSIQTDSMHPTIEPGDLIIDKSIKSVDKLKVNDIITYWTVINGERVLNTHRIHQIYDGGDFYTFETIGDNNTAKDSLTVHESEVVGLYLTKVPGFGKVFDYLQTGTGFFIVIVIPVFLFFVYQLIQFFRTLFEYQSVKNRIKYEEEHGSAEELLAEREAAAEAQREALKAQLRAELIEEAKREAEAEALAKATETNDESDSSEE